MNWMSRPGWRSNCPITAN